MSPWKARTRANGGERFCRLSTWPTSLAAGTWQSELSSCAFIGRSVPAPGSRHPAQRFFKEDCRHRRVDSAVPGPTFLQRHEENDGHNGSRRESRLGNRLRCPGAVNELRRAHPDGIRSEERRVGKECRYRWSPCQYKRKRERYKSVEREEDEKSTAIDVS